MRLHWCGKAWCMQQGEGDDAIPDGKALAVVGGLLIQVDMGREGGGRLNGIKQSEHTVSVRILLVTFDGHHHVAVDPVQHTGNSCQRAMLASTLPPNFGLK